MITIRKATSSFQDSFSNAEILEAAMKQSAIDMSCTAQDFLHSENKVVISKKNSNARRYLELPFAANIVSYGNNIVASCSPILHKIVEKYISSFAWYRCFETPNMHALSEKIRPLGFDICFMAEYWLPSINSSFFTEDRNFHSKDKFEFETKLLEPDDFQNLYLPEWSNALSEDRRNLDVIAVGAFCNEKLVGLAGCSADCDTMWQIGVDVLPEFRRKGIASAITSKLAEETLRRAKIPFYCCAWSNIASARNAIRSGFRPAWCELTVKPLEEIEKMNKNAF